MPSHLGYRLAEDAAPMKLCRLCSRLNTDFFVKYDLPKRPPFANPLEHQPCFTALETSALPGCGMCCMFMEGAVQEVLKYKKCSPSEAYQALRNAESEIQPREPCLLKSNYKGNLTGDQHATLDYIGYSIPFCFHEEQPSEARPYFSLRNCCGKPNFRRGRCHSL